jgi:disulfide bond formation protein DsbB
MKRATGLLLFGIVAPLLAVGVALFTQYRLDMQPCPWCVLQRVIFLAVALACALGLARRRPGGALALLLSLCGVAAALWQHFVAAASASCNLTLADRIVGALGLNTWWPDVFEARASCSDAAVRLAGVPYEFWSLGLFVLLAVASLAVLRGDSRPR